MFIGKSSNEMLHFPVRKLLVYWRLPGSLWLGRVLCATGHALVTGDEVVRQGQEFPGGGRHQDGPETVWCLWTWGR